MGQRRKLKSNANRRKENYYREFSRKPKKAKKEVKEEKTSTSAE